VLSTGGAAALGLAMVQFLARGMTSPLREMAAAARAMAGGDHNRRVTASSRDEVGELARAFNAMAAVLAEVDRLRRDLVANVSHELRTPISALQAELENLVDGIEPPDPQTLRTMLRQAERLGGLIAQLLDLSRLESGAVPLQRRVFDVGALLEDAAAEARLAASGVAVAVAAEPGLAVDGDPERVHQVVANLLENAVRYSPPGGAVEVHARAGALLVAVAAATLLASGRLHTWSARLATAAAPLFGVWLAIRTSPWLVPLGARERPAVPLHRLGRLEPWQRARRAGPHPHLRMTRQLCGGPCWAPRHPSTRRRRAGAIARPVPRVSRW
jgi:nitrogen fixation/metabolism regulation signal transduction histidine kinase